MKIFIDFETYSMCELNKCGAWVYAEHPSTGIFCMSYCITDTELPEIWIPGEAVPEIFKAPDIEIVAHNALFEYAIVYHILTPKYSFPESLHDPFCWICTQTMAYMMGLPGQSDKVAVRLRLGQSKLAAGAALIQKYSKPKKRGKGKDSELIPITPEDFDALKEYCIQDTVLTRLIYTKLKKFANYTAEKKAYRLTLWQNVQGLPIDHPALDKCLAVIAALKTRAETEMDVLGVNVRSVPKMLEFLNVNGCAVSNIQKSTMEALKTQVTDEKVLKILQLRHFLGKSSLSKYTALDNRRGVDGRVHNTLKHYGAHTGRWSGQGFQPHNLPKMGTTPIEIETVLADFDNTLSYAECIKQAKIILPGIIKSTPDNTFLIGDFAAIEARGLAMLIDDQTTLQQFASGQDLYKIMAAKIYDTAVVDITKEERQLGKVTILACGYGMGGDTFKETCAGWNISIRVKFAEDVVATYRATYPKVPIFWKNLERAVILVFRNGGTRSVGKFLQITARGTTIIIALPSGRELFYHSVSVQKENFTYRGKNFIADAISYLSPRGYREHTYGGKLAENVTQAVCRDILADCMWKCYSAGLRPILHIHDEIVCEVQKTTARADLKIFDEIMNTAPAWFDGFPLATTTEISARYYK